MKSDDDDQAHRRPTILVIDDDEIIRELVKLHLRNADYQVLEAEDAVIGGHLILQRRPDLVLCDVDMPYLNGYDLVAALKGDSGTRDIPVVFLTMNEDVARQAKKLGAVAYLMKPVKADKLLEVVALFAQT